VGARESILGRIVDSKPSDPPASYRLSDLCELSLLDLFSQRLTELGAKVVQWSDLSRLTGRRWSVDSSVGTMPEDCGPFELASAWEADVGVTRAVVGVAETGSVLIQHEASDHRLASLAPPLHVVVLKESGLVFALEQAFDRLNPGNAVLVTGPSRTADIEGVLVRGVHGPRDVWVVFEQD
jgi:L-lactate dehydrogenase complex protein LldG